MKRRFIELLLKDVTTINERVELKELFSIDLNIKMLDYMTF